MNIESLNTDNHGELWNELLIQKGTIIMMWKCMMRMLM